MIKKNRKQLILSSIVIMLPVLVGLFIWNYLPEKMAIHWAADGETNGWGSKQIAVFTMPVLMLVSQWACVLFTTMDPRNKNQSSKIMSMVLWICPILSVIISSYIFSFSLGAEMSADLIFRIPMALMFLILGNYMPKCKQNHVIGVRVPWTLRNEENWNKTHRFCGKLWVIGGVGLFATLFIPMEKTAYWYLATILILAFIPIIYSYGYYRKQVKAGTASNEEEKIPLEKRWNKISAIICIIILASAGMLLFTGDFQVEFADTSFSIETSYWDDATISYADINTIEYRQQDDTGSRTFGYGSLTLMMGEFENSEFGNYTRYSYTKCDDCIVISVADEILVVNGEDEQATKDIYDQLVTRTE